MKLKPPVGRIQVSPASCQMDAEKPCPFSLLGLVILLVATVASPAAVAAAPVPVAVTVAAVAVTAADATKLP